VKRCAYAGCRRAHYAVDLCLGHYAQRRRGVALHPIRTREKRCKVRGCTRPHRARGMCASHYRSARRRGLPLIRVKQPQEPQRDAA
jgi:hypothetical protein